MPFELVVVAGEEAGRRIPLPGSGKLTIGREATNDVVILARGLSRHHCVVHHDPGKVRIVDLGSSNGTRVNGERIEQATLCPGDRIGLSDVEIELVSRTGTVAEPSAVLAEDNPTDIVTFTCLHCSSIFWPEDLKEGRVWDTESGPICEACAEKSDERIEMRIGRFRLVERIGRGGMGTVYRGIDDEDGSEVAIKVLQMEMARDEASRERFAREGEVGFLLDHPNIVRVREVGRFKRSPLIVMDYFEAESLADRLGRNRRLPIGKVRTWILQAADALIHAHDRGVIHRDVKPGNILVDADDHAKVLDFGLGRLLGADRVRLTVSGEILGTLHYAAPEQLEDSKSVDERADVYGLGATLYHLVTGEYPFYHDSHYVLMNKILNQEPPPLDAFRPNIPRRLMEVVLRAMKKDPAERYESARLFRDELEMLLV